MEPIEILVLYNLISLIVTIGLMILCKKVIKKDSTKNLVLKIVSLVVVAIHYSSLYVDFFSTGSAMIEDNMILPVYPCNIIMWMLVIVAFFKNKDSKVYKVLSEYTFIAGTFCAFVGVAFNINFLNDPNLANYDILKGLLSHSVLLFGTIYLGVFDYVKIRVKSTSISIIIGLLMFSLCGILVNTLYYLFDIPSVNAMFMLEPPLPSLPFFNFFTLGLLGILLVFIGLNIYERFALPKEERWLTKIIERRK